MAYADKRKHHPRYRSLFWPMILIGVGTTWLLYNLGLFNGNHISVIFRLWPLLLIAVGADLLFGRKSPSRGATIGLVFVGVMLTMMYLGPILGLHSNVEYRNTTFDIPLAGTDEFNFVIEAGTDHITINPLDDSNNLIEADVWHVGELLLDQDQTDGNTWFAIKQEGLSFDWGLGGRPEEASGWNFMIHPDVALAINFEGGIGETTMDLSQFHLTDLDLDLGVGSLDIILPIPQGNYSVDINGGVGEVTIDIPDDVEVEVVVSTGIGDADLPSDFVQVSGDEDNFLGVDGTWQTPGFEQAENTITIIFDGGVGSFELK